MLDHRYLTWQAINLSAVRPIDVSVGYTHRCVLDDSGVTCWGRNNEGQTNVPELLEPRQGAVGAIIAALRIQQALSAGVINQNRRPTNSNLPILLGSSDQSRDYCTSLNFTVRFLVYSTLPGQRYQPLGAPCLTMTGSEDSWGKSLCNQVIRV